jgi:hypothetical protein
VLNSDGGILFYGEFEPQENEIPGLWTRTENGYWHVRLEGTDLERGSYDWDVGWRLGKVKSFDLPK